MSDADDHDYYDDDDDDKDDYDYTDDDNNNEVCSKFSQSARLPVCPREDSDGI